MVDSLRQRYRIEKNKMERAYEYQLGLKKNPEYERRVDTTFLALVRLFQTMYPEVKIEAPRGREKSDKSLQDKIKKLEIERLCKLYAIEGMTEKEKENLCEIIKSTIEDMKKQGMVDKIFFGQLRNLKTLESLLKDNDIAQCTKTALLRITKTRLQRESRKNKEDLEEQIEEKYGQTAARKSQNLDDNLLHWECIENIEQKDLDKLHNPFEYLRVKDLRGIKIVVAEVPDNFQTNNEQIAELIEKRQKAVQGEKTKYNDLCCIAITQDFVNQLIHNEELLEKLNISLIQDGYKHKEKQNGYLAEHVKFCYRDHPEYIFELQLRSLYREDISRANGKAAHDKRSGKKRVFPSATNKKTFLEKLQSMVPNYTLLKYDYHKNEYYIHKCTLAENMLEYYLGYITLDSEEYVKVMKYLEEESVQK